MEFYIQPVSQLLSPGCDRTRGRDSLRNNRFTVTQRFLQSTVLDCSDLEQ